MGGMSEKNQAQFNKVDDESNAKHELAMAAVGAEGMNSPLAPSPSRSIHPP